MADEALPGLTGASDDVDNIFDALSADEMAALMSAAVANAGGEEGAEEESAEEEADESTEEQEAEEEAGTEGPMDLAGLGQAAQDCAAEVQGWADEAASLVESAKVQLAMNRDAEVDPKAVQKAADTIATCAEDCQAAAEAAASAVLAEDIDAAASAYQDCAAAHDEAAEAMGEARTAGGPGMPVVPAGKPAAAPAAADPGKGAPAKPAPAGKPAAKGGAFGAWADQATAR